MLRRHLKVLPSMQKSLKTFLFFKYKFQTYSSITYEEKKTTKNTKKKFKNMIYFKCKFQTYSSITNFF